MPLERAAARLLRPFRTAWIAVRRLPAEERGLTLLETVIALTFAGVATTAVTGLLAAGILSSDAVTSRTAGTLLARSQMESVLGEAYVEGGPYPVLEGLPSDIVVDITVQSVIPQYLQKVTVSVGRTLAGEQNQGLAQLSTMKSNRYLTSGRRPTAGGLGVTHAVLLPVLPPQTGVFMAVNVIPSATLGQIVARWQLDATAPVGLSTEPRPISVTIYTGSPFGPGSGTSTDDPALVAATKVGGGSATDVILEVSTASVTSQVYTVYFYNADTVDDATTARARLSCICPQL